LDPFRKHATQKGLTFEISEDDNMLRFVRSDLQRFQQALTQLVTNAIKHTANGGVKIHLGARLTAEEYCVVQVSVQDTGVGMTERELDRLFQEFEQVPDEGIESDEAMVNDTEELSTSNKGAKLGLGLALVARYIKQCGGRVRGQSIAGQGSIFSLDIPMQLGKEHELASASASGTPSGLYEERSGKGARRPVVSPTAESTTYSHTPSSFRLHIDRVRPHSERSPAHADSERGSGLAIRSSSPRMVVKPRPASSNTKKPATPNAGKPVVLIADDNSVNLSILKRRLERMGHEVKTSVDGQECFDVYQEHQHTVQFILMDISVRTSSLPSSDFANREMQMPIVDGIQSTRMIRSFESVELPAPTSQLPEPAVPHALPSETTIAIDVGQASKPSLPPTSASPISPPPTNLGPEEDSKDPSNSGYFNLPLSPSRSDLTSNQHSVAPALISPIDLPPADLEHMQERSKSGTHAPRRIPIFAVSAGLNQYSQDSLEDAGFDGWLSKPIDFKKLAVIMEGVRDHDVRGLAMSRDGDYGGGGWFE
jgi:CheY-like chemotaxis protein/anti-sigma regulatory factor (Ser/Thr protein kinase)